MTYTAQGEKLMNKVVNEAVKEAHLAKIEKKNCPNAMKDRLRKTRITVSVKIVYPPHGKYEQQRKGGPRPRFRAHHKKAARITYNAMQEETIKDLLPELKTLLHKKGMGKHAFIREIPEDEGIGLSMQRYKEDMNVHTAQSECATIGTMSGIIALDTAVALELEADGEGDLSTFVNWSLRDLLTKQEQNGKELFRAIAMQEDGSIMAIVCRGDGRDEAMANIAGSPAAWAMFTLLLEHNATEESVQAFLGVCFSSMHATAATEYGEYDRHTGKVALVDNFEGEEGVNGQRRRTP